jgi:alkylation response protein AidB-like acyl-CoA dehydrogenase
VYFALRPEQRQRQDLLRALLAERMPETAVRTLMADPAGDDPQLWPEVARLAGSTDPADVAATLEVLGERLYVGPYLSSIVMAGALLADSAEVAAIRAGRLRVAVAIADERAGVSVTPAGLVSGSRDFVLDGMTADRLLVCGLRGGAACVVEVDATGPGVTRVPTPVLDQTRKLARVELADVPGEILALDGDSALDTLRRMTHAAVAAEQVGCAQGALDVALGYARQRRQFGRVIGSYQAVKHRFAEIVLLVEQARAASYHALLTLSQDAVSHARIVSTRAALESSEWCMQVQAGHGFRWDNVAHLYLKRAKATQLLFGDPARECERIAELLGLT